MMAAIFDDQSSDGLNSDVLLKLLAGIINYVLSMVLFSQKWLEHSGESAGLPI